MVKLWLVDKISLCFLHQCNMSFRSYRLHIICAMTVLQMRLSSRPLVGFSVPTPTHLLLHLDCLLLLTKPLWSQLILYAWWWWHHRFLFNWILIHVVLPSSFEEATNRSLSHLRFAKALFLWWVHLRQVFRFGIRVLFFMLVVLDKKKAFLVLPDIILLLVHFIEQFLKLLAVVWI